MAMNIDEEYENDISNKLIVEYRDSHIYDEVHREIVCLKSINKK